MVRGAAAAQVSRPADHCDKYGHYHDLLNDIGQEQVIDDIVAWIEVRQQPRLRAEIPIMVQ